MATSAVHHLALCSLLGCFACISSSRPWQQDEELHHWVRDTLESRGGACTLQRVSADAASMEVAGLWERPFVLNGAVADWPALAWTRNALQRRYGDSIVMPRSPHVLAFWVAGAASKGGVARFADFVELAGNHSIFDRGSTGGTLVEKMRADGDWAEPAAFEGKRMDQHCLAMGPSGHGFPFHSHCKTWQAQVLGQKLWLLHEPLGLPSKWELAHPRALLESLAHGAPSSRLQHCLLSPGELIFFPNLWWHATLNVGESMGIGMEQVEDTEEEQRLLMTTDLRKHPKARQFSIQSLLADGQVEEAAEFSRKAYKFRPTEPSLVITCLKALLTAGKTQPAQKMLSHFNRTLLALHADRWLGDAALSGILGMVAFALTSVSASGAVKLPQRALELNLRAAELDPSNWAAQINVAHNHLALSDLESALLTLHKIPASSDGSTAASKALQELCDSMGKKLPRMRARFCKGRTIEL